MRKSTWIKIHIFCGLFTSWYILAFAISSIILNHDLKVDKNKIDRTWTTYVAYDSSRSDLDNATWIRDTLKLMGWIPTWEIRNDENHLIFKITHLGKSSDLRLNLTSGKVQITERPKGLLAVVHGLHFFNGKVPNAPLFLKSWMIYQWLTLFVLFISLCTGLWLWLRYGHKSWELYFFGAVFLISILLMTAL